MDASHASLLAALRQLTIRWAQLARMLPPTERTVLSTAHDELVRALEPYQSRARR